MSKTGQKGPWTLEETQDSSITKREIVDFLQENADTPFLKKHKLFGKVSYKLKKTEAVDAYKEYLEAVENMLEDEEVPLQKNNASQNGKLPENKEHKLETSNEGKHETKKEHKNMNGKEEEEEKITTSKTSKQPKFKMTYSHNKKKKSHPFPHFFVILFQLALFPIFLGIRIANYVDSFLPGLKPFQKMFDFADRIRHRIDLFVFIVIPSIITSFIKKLSRSENRIEKKRSLLLNIMVNALQTTSRTQVEDLPVLKRIIDVVNSPIPTKRVRIEDISIGSMHCYILTPKNLAHPERLILYFHGGGFVSCPWGTYRRLVSNLALTCSSRVLFVDYRLAPEYKWPIQLQDCLTAYDWARSPKGGKYEPKNISLAGDAAGGCLSLIATLSLRDKGEPLPGSVIAISPWTDLTLQSESWETNETYDYMPTKQEMANLIASYYLKEKVNLNDYLVSPAFANFANFPPLLLQVSDAEQLYGDSKLVFEKTKQAKVDSKLEVYHNLPHAFHIFGKVLKESQQVNNIIIYFF